MIDKLQRAVANPSKARSVAQRKLYESVIRKPLIRYLERRCGPDRTTDHFSEDWDSLIILDACRYDAFAAVSNLNGELGWKLSSGSATLNWMRATIGDQEFYDTVFVGANPRISRYEGQFHAIDHVWDHGWDDDLNVTPPELVTTAALKAREQYPNKRLVIHYMQPHEPYIGTQAREQLGIGTGDAPGRERALSDGISELDGSAWDNVSDRVHRGEISSQRMIRAYRENLELVLPHVRRLLGEFDGRTVVSADHGELFGGRGWPYPRRCYGHPNRVPAFKLRQVPWLVAEQGSRPEITVETPKSEPGLHAIDNEDVSSKLRHLGYLDT